MSSNPLIRMHSDFNSDSNFDFSFIFFSSALQVLLPSNSFHGSPFFNSFGHVLIWLQRDRVCEKERERETESEGGRNRSGLGLELFMRLDTRLRKELAAILVFKMML